LPKGWIAATASLMWPQPISLPPSPMPIVGMPVAETEDVGPADGDAVYWGDRCLLHAGGGYHACRYRQCARQTLVNSTEGAGRW